MAHRLEQVVEQEEFEWLNPPAPDPVGEMRQWLEEYCPDQKVSVPPLEQVLSPTCLCLVSLRVSGCCCILDNTHLWVRTVVVDATAKAHLCRSHGVGLRISDVDHVRPAAQAFVSGVRWSRSGKFIMLHVLRFSPRVDGPLM